MSAYTRETSDGRPQICLWAGPGEPDLTDDNVWTDLDDAEALLREWAATASGVESPFTPVGAARVWARWNAKAPGRR